MEECKKGFEVQAMRSAAGYYLGTRDGEGFPQCRISTEYAKTAEQAEKILIPDRQNAMENCYCNGGCGCEIKEVQE